jgi:threonine dehydratase
MAYAAQELKLLVEPGGAAGLAALLAGKIDAKNKTVAIVLSGGNVEFAQLAEIVGRLSAQR